MALRQLCKLFIRVRFSYPPPILALVVYWYYNCLVSIRRRFDSLLGHQVLCRRFLTIEGSTFYLRGNRSVCSSFLGIVKWYHPCFGSMKRKFDSSYRDQFLGCVQQILYIELLIQTVKKHPVV